MEAPFTSYLVEDKGPGSLAYAEFLQVLQRGTMTKT